LWPRGWLFVLWPPVFVQHRFMASVFRSHVVGSSSRHQCHVRRGRSEPRSPQALFGGKLGTSHVLSRQLWRNFTLIEEFPGRKIIIESFQASPRAADRGPHRAATCHLRRRHLRRPRRRRRKIIIESFQAPHRAADRGPHRATGRFTQSKGRIPDLPGRRPGGKPVQVSRAMRPETLRPCRPWTCHLRRRHLRRPRRRRRPDHSRRTSRTAAAMAVSRRATRASWS